MAETKPIFKAPEKKPFQVSEPAPPPVAPANSPPEPVVEAAPDWQPIDTAPQDSRARFRVRATVLGKDGKTRVPVLGTEAMVRYRKSRKMANGRWKFGLTIIDDLLETKLGFRPSEWDKGTYVPPPEEKVDA